MKYACKNDGLPEPEYVIHPEDIMIKFTAPENRVARVNNRTNNQLSANEYSVLNALTNEPGFTVSKLAEFLNLSKKTIARTLKNLRTKEIIERVGNNRKGYWKIKN